MDEPNRTVDRASRQAARPVLHFTPPSNWMNDPNGLVRVGDTFHLFYQHNPDGIEHANLHWGHACSPDLHTWSDLPVALAPDELGEAYSGTVVIDKGNSAGFGDGALVAMFTNAAPNRQVQSLAYSNDDGTTWAKYEGNPVLAGPFDMADFRDPRLMRHESPKGDQRWVVIVAAFHELWIYRSDDLKAWERVSSFAPQRPWPSATVEVPELLRVPVAGENRYLWVLILCFHERLTDGSIATEILWAPGDFNGLAFNPIWRDRHMEPLDYGPRFYAAQGWQTGPSGAPVLIGWMDERDRYQKAPDLPWCGRMSLPRELSMRVDGDDYALVQRPLVPPGVLSAGELLHIEPGKACSCDDLPPVFKLSLSVRDPEDRVLVSLESLTDSRERFALVVEDSRLVMEVEGRAGFDPVAVEAVPARPFEAEIFVDTGSIEVFWERGAHVASFTSGIGLGGVAAEVTNSTADQVQMRIDPLSPDEANSSHIGTA